MNKFVFSLTLRPAIKEVFSDLERESDVVTVYKPYQINNCILNFLYRTHMSKKLNDIIDLPFKSLWKRFYAIEKIDWKINNDNFLIIIDSSLVWYSADYLNKLREQKKIRLILLLFNPMNELIKNHTFMNIYNKTIFDMKFSTFDVRDPQEYGCIQTYSIYSKQQISSSNIKSDMVYLGMDKGRHKTIVSILKKIEQQGFLTDFSIINCKIPSDERYQGIKYTNEVPYISYLNKISNSKCILEIVQESQNGITLRTFEAIVYRKHLLTNNVFVKDMPFFDDRYIHVFDSIENIDLEFLYSPNEADYGYDGQFSPIFLKEEILCHIGKHRGEK